MSEYFYHKGSLHLKKDYSEGFLTELEKSEYPPKETYTVSKNSKGVTIEIDTQGFGSYPVSFLTQFEKLFSDVTFHISKKSTLQCYLYNYGSYKLTFLPGSNDYKKEFVSKDDVLAEQFAVANLPKTGAGETSLLWNHISIMEELIENRVARNLSEEQLKKLLEEYYLIIQKHIKKGDDVELPIGLLSSKESIEKSRKKIFFFKLNEEVKKSLFI